MLTETVKQNLYSAIMGTYQTNEYVAWNPFTPDRLLPYYYTEYVKRLLICVETLERSGVPSKDIAHQLTCVTSLREELHALLAYWGQGDLQISAEDLNQVAGYIIELLLHICEDEPFSENGHFRIFTGERVDSLVRVSDWHVASLEVARELGKVTVAGTSLAYALYTDVWPKAAGDAFHGPYDAGERGLFVARDYVDLAPAELWPHVSDWQIRQLSVLTCYELDTDLQIDYEGGPSSDDNLPQRLRYWKVLVNGQPISASEIPVVYRSLARYVATQVKVTESLELEGLKKWFLESHCYLQRELLAMAGIDWKPTAAMYATIAGKPLLPEVEDLVESRRKSIKRAVEALNSI